MLRNKFQKFIETLRQNGSNVREQEALISNNYPLVHIVHPLSISKEDFGMLDNPDAALPASILMQYLLDLVHEYQDRIKITVISPEYAKHLETHSAIEFSYRQGSFYLTKKIFQKPHRS